MTEPKIINISTRELSCNEIKLLKRGLKFTPTPQQNRKELKTDLQEFGRKLRLLDYFNGHGQQLDNSLVKNKSNFVPPKPNDGYLSLFIESLSNLREPNPSPPTKNNISSSERAALNHLERDDSIIIKEADKGGATVIMDKTYYRSKILELLTDTENYQELTQGNEDDTIMKKIKRLTKEYEHELTKNEIDYIHKFAWKTSNFYGLPKIHKSPTIKTAVKEQNADYVKLSPPSDLKMRPIVAGPSSPTHRLSNFLDLILKPLCKKVPSFIRDDMDFLNHIPNEISENTLLVSFDVVSLYTSIPHDLGLEAIGYWLDNYSTSLTRPFSKEFLLKAISIVLQQNTFQFDEKNYKQIQGTAMGTKMAPTYATLVMGFLEKRLYTKYEEKYGSNETENFIREFKRYLDDCFLLWRKSEEELLEFHNLLNNLHPKIQFTMEKDANELPFLDILLYKEETKLFTDIYYKGTDTHQYLDFHSCHPKHTKYNIPYTLARRICAIVTKEDVRNKRLRELEKFLQKQNYPNTIIKKGIEKASALEINELRSAKEKHETNKILPLVITHNPNNPQVIGTIKENLKFLNNSTKMKSVLDQTKVIVSRRQPKNLKRHLMKAQFSSEKITPVVTKCEEPRCGTCNYLKTGNSITLKNGKVWTIKSTMNCKARNVIYTIICTKCESFYIGQTENLRNRVTLHKEQIRHKQYRHLAVSEHLEKCNNGNFTIMPIYQCQDSSRLIRESKEKEIISLLRPDLNSN